LASSDELDIITHLIGLHCESVSLLKNKAQLFDLLLTIGRNHASLIL